MMRPLLIDRLKEMFSYDAEAGTWVRLIRAGTRFPGPMTPTVVGGGYAVIKIDGESYYAHRVAWLYHYGKWPDHTIDHINGNRTDNRIANLRDVTVEQNNQNVIRANGQNSTGLRGAHAHNSGKFTATIRVQGRQQYLGIFDTAEEAHAVYIEAKRKLHAGCSI